MHGDSFRLRIHAFFSRHNSAFNGVGNQWPVTAVLAEECVDMSDSVKVH